MRLFILASLLFTTTAALASPFGFKKGQLDLYTEGSYVSTSRNYNDDGVLYQLPGNNQLQEINLLIGADYDFGVSWGLRVETNIRQLKGLSSQGYTYNNTTTGIADITLGTDFSAYDYGKFKFTPDFSVLIPVSGVPGDDASAFLNDGAVWVSGKLYVSRDFWILKNALYGGFTWRSQGFSSQIPLGIIMKTNGKNLFLDLKAFGEISMGNDQYSATPSTRLLSITQYNGGSLLYGGVNPSFFSLKATVGWNVTSSWSLGVGVLKTVYGIRAADEMRFLAQLKYSGNAGGGRSHPKFQSDDHDQFEVDTEE